MPAQWTPPGGNTPPWQDANPWGISGPQAQPNLVPNALSSFLGGTSTPWASSIPSSFWGGQGNAQSTATNPLMRFLQAHQAGQLGQGGQMQPQDWLHMLMGGQYGGGQFGGHQFGGGQFGGFQPQPQFPGQTA